MNNSLSSRPKLVQPLFIDANVANDPRKCQYAYLQNIIEVKKQIRSCVNSLVVTLKEREDRLCQDVEDHCLKVMNSWKECSKQSTKLLGYDPCDCSMCYAPFRLRFVSDGDYLLQNLQRFGFIQVDALQNPNSWTIWGTKENEIPRSSSPVSTVPPTSSPDTSGTSESFDVLNEAELTNHPSKLLSRTSSYEELTQEVRKFARELSSIVDTELQPAATLRHQLGLFRHSPVSSPSAADSTTQHDPPVPNPSCVIREKFEEYFCDDREKWLTPMYRE